MAVTGRPIEAPNWVRARISDAVARQAPRYDIDFGKLSLVFEDGWQPRIQVQNVAVEDTLSGTALELAEVDTTLSLTDLASGQVSPRVLSVAGVTLKLRRLADGSFNVAFGEGDPLSASVTQLADLGPLVEALFARPELAHVERIETKAVTLRYDDVRAGRGWTIDGAEMRLDRDADGAELAASLSLLGGRDYASTVEVSIKSAFHSPQFSVGFTFSDVPASDIASQSAALAWLDVIRAPISGAVRIGLDEEGALTPMNATLQIGAGVVKPNDTVRAIPFRSGRSYLTFDPQTAEVTFQELSVDSAWAKATATGRMILKPGSTDAQDPLKGFGNEMLGQFTLTEIEANPMDLYDDPLTLEQVYADVRLRLDPFELTLGQAVVRDRDHMLVLDGRLLASGVDWDLALNGHMDRMEPTWLVDLWPQNAKAKTRTWIDTNILGGVAEDVNVALRSHPGAKPDLYADFRFRQADVKFARSLPPAEGAVGYATLLNNRFSVYVEQGTVLADAGGRVDATGTVFEILDTRIKKPPARVGLRATGTITAGLSLLNRKPLALMSKNDLPVTLADGMARATGELRFNLRKKIPPKEVKFDVEARLASVRTQHFVKDKVIASSGLVVQATNKGVRIGGRGRIGSMPFNGAWNAVAGPENKGKSHVSGTITFTAESLADFGIEFPPGWISGEGQGDMDIQLVKGEAARFRLTSDLAGMVLRIPPLGWNKSAGKTVSLIVEGRLGERDKGTPAVVDKLSLNGLGLSAKGGVTLEPGGGLKVARFDTFRLGDWLNVRGELRGRGNGQPPQLVVQGGRVDMRGLPPRQGSGSSTGTGGPIHARLERVQVSDGIVLTAFSGEFTNGGKNGLFVAKINDRAGITGTMTPRGDRSAYRIRSDDAGAVMAAAGLYKTAHGGVMDLMLTPQGTGNYDGEMTINDTRVRNAPAIAELLNAISIVGLLEQLDGTGINFSEVYARFRLTPDKLILAESSAVGPSMGISMDGLYDAASGQMDMQGVLSPVYVVNSVGRIISKRGEGLIGFNYNIRGSTARPQVTVNPLSALTPGFFREIFRRPAPELQN